MDHTGRRARAAAITITSAALLLSACGSAGSDGNGDHTGEVGGDLRFSWWGSELRNVHTNAVIDLFQDEHGVNVNGEPVDFRNYFERLNVQAASGNMPCVTQMLTFALNDYVKNDLFVELSDTGVLDGLDESIVEALTADDGGVYMAPYGIAPSVIVYNSDWVDEYGIDVPAGDVSWDDLWAWLDEIQSVLPEGQFAIDYPYNTPVEVITYLASRGPVFQDGQPVFDPADLAEWFDEWKQLEDDGVLVPGDRTSDYLGSHEDSAIAQGVVFASARPANAIVAIEQAMAAHGLNGEVDYILLPVGSDGAATDLLPINGLSIPKSCDNTASAVAFIDFWLNDEEANEAFAANNGAPTVAAYRDMLAESPDSDESTIYMIDIAQQVVDRGHLAVDLPPGFNAGFLDTYRRLSLSVLTDATDSASAAQEIFDLMAAEAGE